MANNAPDSYWRVSWCLSVEADLVNGISGGRLNQKYYNIDRKLLFQIIRAGPWAPPVSQPVGSSVLIVSEAGKDRLKGRMRPELEFQPVIKKKIVEVPFEYWRPDFELQCGIDGLDPATYLLNVGQHSEIASEEMGPLWEIVLPCGAYFYVVKLQDSRHLRIDSESLRGWHIFFASNRQNSTQLVVASSQGRELLESIDDAGALRFEALPSGPAPTDL